MNPKHLKYTETHEWAHAEDGIVTIGITAHAIEQLSDLVFLNLPDVGESVTAGESFGEVESVKAVSDLKSPCTGEVVEVNVALEDDLSLVGSDPYGDGWMIRVRSDDALDALMSASEYARTITEGA